MYAVKTSASGVDSLYTVRACMSNVDSRLPFICKRRGWCTLFVHASKLPDILVIYCTLV